MAEPNEWGGERNRRSIYDAPVYGLPVESLYRPDQSVPRAARTRRPKRPGHVAPPEVTGANEQEIAAKQQEIAETIRVTAGFFALHGQLTPPAARHNLDEKLGPFIRQEATTVALGASTPAAIIMRQRARLAGAALEVLMSVPLGGDKPAE